MYSHGTNMCTYSMLFHFMFNIFLFLADKIGDYSFTEQQLYLSWGVTRESQIFRQVVGSYLHISILIRTVSVHIYDFIYAKLIIFHAIYLMFGFSSCSIGSRHLISIIFKMVTNIHRGR